METWLVEALGYQAWNARRRMESREIDYLSINLDKEKKALETEDGWLVQRCAKLLHHFLLLNSNFA